MTDDQQKRVEQVTAAIVGCPGGDLKCQRAKAPNWGGIIHGERDVGMKWDTCGTCFRRYYVTYGNSLPDEFIS